MAPWIGMNALGLSAGLAVASVLVGCSSSTEVDDTERNAAVYRAVVIDVVDRSDVVLNDVEELPVLFIDAFDPEGIELEVQVELVSSFIEEYEIRFIDDRNEAVDTDLVGLPVRPNSLLIGLGPIVVDDTVNVRGELYLSADVVSAYRYTVVGRDGSWQIVGGPEEIDPEGFVPVS